MKKPRGRTRGESGRLNTSVANPANSCPWPCLVGGRMVVLFDRAGEPQATRCIDCDGVLTRLAWLSELERGAGHHGARDDGGAL